MLDDFDYIDRIDSDDALSVITSQAQQLDYSPDINPDTIKGGIEKIVTVGMGGSALASDIARNWLQDVLDIPFTIVRDYDLPHYVDERTLVICSSYSGNTEETLSGLDQALDKGAQIVVITKGGRLAEIAADKGLTLVTIPEGYQPRMAVWYNLKVLAEMFEKLGLAEAIVEQLVQSRSLLAAAAKEWGRDSPETDNYAKQIAGQLMGKAVWIYSGPALISSAYKWKINFNENAKNVASYNEIPEFSHNEYLGWTSHPVEKPFGVVELTSSLDHPQVQKRFEVSNRLLSGRMPSPVIVEAKGQNRIEQLLWTSLLGDFVSVYCGILNGVNPTRVDDIEKLKRELA